MRAICNVCCHHCSLEEGRTGACGARTNKGGQITASNYGRLTALALDPIEKKPLARFMPGSRILSVGSYGCTCVVLLPELRDCLSRPACMDNDWESAGRNIDRTAGPAVTSSGPGQSGNKIITQRPGPLSRRNSGSRQHRLKLRIPRGNCAVSHLTFAREEMSGSPLPIMSRWSGGNLCVTLPGFFTKTA